MDILLLGSPKEYSYAADLKEMPVLKKGQVLIKVECGVINPTDTYFLSGQYNGTYEYPLVPGL
jgi:NADPH:quinone reductase-like Zn-dependent oxidoreductase